MTGKIPIAKTYKLFIDGAFPRSESGRTFSVNDTEGELIANVSQASRKDFREAVRAARAAQLPWASRTAYNRGQILYRVAEMLESRKTEFVELLKSIGVNSRSATREIEDSIQRWVWYAGQTSTVRYWDLSILYQVPISILLFLNRQEWSGLLLQLNPPCWG